MSKKHTYPMWQYHKTQPPKLVHSAEEEAALGKEWVDSPAEFGLEPVLVKGAQGMEVIEFKKPEVKKG